MTCRDVNGLLSLFFDGELDARQMRDVALHSSRCADCEGELRRFERGQELVATTVRAQIDDLDLSQVWPAVAERIGSIRVPWWQRARLWWEAREPLGWRPLPAFGVVAATAAVALVLWSGRPDAPQVAEVPPVVDNSATIDSLDSNAEAVAVLSEPETNTTVLWVNDESDYGDEGFPP
jgi:hypothetical protein